MPNKPTDPTKRGGEDATVIDGIVPSADIRQQLIDSGDDLLLAFSGGKDSLATWLAMLDSGIDPDKIYPYYMYSIPNLKFVNDQLDEFEQIFQRPIGRYPNPRLYQRLKYGTMQPPDRRAVIRAARIPEITENDVIAAIEDDYGLERDRWRMDGVRATDSIVRRISMKRHGPMKPHLNKVSPIWDWKIADVRNAMAFHKIPWPIDYEWFGRSFDGIDYRFIKPVYDNAPDDFERLKEWYPFLELELIRHDLRK